VLFAAFAAAQDLTFCNCEEHDKPVHVAEIVEAAANILLGERSKVMSDEECFFSFFFSFRFFFFFLFFFCFFLFLFFFSSSLRSGGAGYRPSPKDARWT
jgi:hypothetical protein